MARLMATSWKGILLALGMSALFSFTASLTPVWQLVLVPPLLAGAISRNGRNAFGVGFGAVLLGWGGYFLIALGDPLKYVMLDQVTAVIIGSTGYGPVVLVIVLVVGGLMGGLAGMLGYSFRGLFDASFQPSKEQNIPSE